MADLLESAGVASHRIVCEDRSASTVASILNCTRLIRQRFNDPAVLVCTDLYHRPRARWLFRLAGLRVNTPPVPGGFSAISARRWVYYVLRELVAIPTDTILVCAHRWAGLTVKR